MNAMYLQYLTVTSGTEQEAELAFGLQPKSLKPLLADYSSPMYVYDLEILKSRAMRLKEALPQFNIHYAIKANFHPQILKTLKGCGLKVDTVSWGEAVRAMENGFNPQDVVFSGVGKTVREIDEALKAGIHQINVESPSELKRIQGRAMALGKKISIAIRINPDVDIKTHPYIATGLLENKFGVNVGDLPKMFSDLQRTNLVELRGLTMHLGSQMKDMSGFRDGLRKLIKIFTETRQQVPTLDRLDIGGGLGIFYEDETAENDFKLLTEYSEILKTELAPLLKLIPNLQLQTEPGRWLVARSGGLLAQIQYIKTNGPKKFVILDGGMNLLMRPILYGAYHKIWPVHKRNGKSEKVDVVGPICESTDFLAKGRELSPLQEGDFLWIADTGAYGSVMASNYNLQPVVIELFI